MKKDRFIKIFWMLTFRAKVSKHMVLQIKKNLIPYNDANAFNILKHFRRFVGALVSSGCGKYIFCIHQFEIDISFFRRMQTIQIYYFFLKSNIYSIGHSHNVSSLLKFAHVLPLRRFYIWLCIRL